MKPHPKVKAEHAIRVKAARLFRMGVSDPEVGRQCGYSKSWAAMLRKRIAAGLEPEVAADAVTTPPEADPPPRTKGLPPPPRRPAPPADAPPEAMPAEMDLSARGQLRRLEIQMQKTARLQDMASADGNTSAAQKYGRDLVELSKVISRLQKESRDDVEGVLLTPEVVAAADLELDGLLAGFAQWGPVTCARCGRELRSHAAENPPNPEKR